MSEVNPILCTDNIVVSGEFELPFVIESDNNQSIIIIGKANSYDSDWVDINTALKRLLRNEAQETDFYGDFICLKLFRNNVNIYTDPFGQFPVYYAINSNGSISLSDGAMCKSL
ncbi:hypothetical protein IR497_004811, partial [Salmonella enterica]|nr:hypothetical protein [Salmonella enterica]